VGARGAARAPDPGAVPGTGQGAGPSPAAGASPGAGPVPSPATGPALVPEVTRGRMDVTGPEANPGADQDQAAEAAIKDENQLSKYITANDFGQAADIIHHTSSITFSFV